MLVNIIKTYIIYYYGGCRLLCMCDTRLPYIWDTWTPLHVGHTLPYMLDKWIPLHLRHKTPIYLGQMDSFTFRTQSSYTCGTHRLLYMWDKWTPLHIGYMDPFTCGTHKLLYIWDTCCMNRKRTCPSCHVCTSVLSLVGSRAATYRWWTSSFSINTVTLY